MKKEVFYSKSVGSEHVKTFGQYFTNDAIADFMTKWACFGADHMLDPAVGNSVFFRYAKKNYPACRLTGFEIDKTILDFFGNPTGADLRIEDYLMSDWDTQYDAIVCNPPYHKFQSVTDRKEILQEIWEHTGIKYSGYTNLYSLFLLKSIVQISEKGRLAYIVPTEFLNSAYGIPIKELLLAQKLIKAIVHFPDNAKLFFHATTTCCILLLDHSPKESVSFINIHSMEDLKELPEHPKHSVRVRYSKLKPEEKWRSYLNHEEMQTYQNLRNISDFCYVSRGIATGANDFFCLSASEIEQYKIPPSCISPCICRSSDVTKPVFTSSDFAALHAAGKKVCLLDAKEEDADSLKAYLSYGIQCGIPSKYLPARRNPWFSMEQKPAAPIWISSACRNTIKVVRNLAEVKSLTTFHSVFVKDEYVRYTDIIFCCLLTPTAQNILRENRKELGNGLDKFQPNDLNSAKMPDITLLSEEDFCAILQIYNEMKKQYRPQQIHAIDDIIKKLI